MNYELADFILIKAITPLHPGVGRGGELVDLPIQRDGLGFPIIYSSSIKGALKSSVNERLSTFLFGPEVGEEKFSAPVAVLDAYLLAFPVRSLIGVYGYATAPVLLKRSKDYIDLAKSLSQVKSDSLTQMGCAIDKLSRVEVQKGHAYVTQKDSLFLVTRLNKIIINEELWLEQQFDDNISSELATVADILQIEKNRLILLSDEDVVRAIEKSLMRVTRVKLKRETKTVEIGPWDEEYIPREAILYTLLLYSKPKVPDSLKNGLSSALGSEPGAERVREKLIEELGRKNNYLVIGGHETIGRGIVKLIFV